MRRFCGAHKTPTELLSGEIFLVLSARPKRFWISSDERRSRVLYIPQSQRVLSTLSDKEEAQHSTAHPTTTYTAFSTLWPTLIGEEAEYDTSNNHIHALLRTLLPSCCAFTCDCAGEECTIVVMWEQKERATREAHGARTGVKNLTWILSLVAKNARPW